MTDRPKNPFNLNANPENDRIRDKDNAKPKLQPKHLNIKPAPNLAPSGAKGIKRGLPSKTPQAKRFAVKKAGDLSKEFKSVAPKAPDKGHGWER